MPPEILTHIYDTPIYKRQIAFLPRRKELLMRARALRKAGVLSEVIFWQHVRNGMSSLAGTNFYGHKLYI